MHEFDVSGSVGGKLGLTASMGRNLQHKCWTSLSRHYPGSAFHFF